MHNSVSREQYYCCKTMGVLCQSAFTRVLLCDCKTSCLSAGTSLRRQLFPKSEALCCIHARPNQMKASPHNYHYSGFLSQLCVPQATFHPLHHTPRIGSTSLGVEVLVVFVAWEYSSGWVDRWWSSSHTLHGTGMYAYIDPPNHPNVGRYMAYMERLGFVMVLVECQ